MRRFLATFLLLAFAPSSVTAAPLLRVAYAGSMGVVMDRNLGPAFAKAYHLTYQGIGQGAYALAHLLLAGSLRADVFISITKGPMAILREKGLAERAMPVASTAMVIAYSPQGRFAAEFAAAAKGRRPWWELLERPGLRFGRTDPQTDPQGRNIIFALRLAGIHYHQPDLAWRILGPLRNPAQIFTEASLLTRLEAGQIDAASSYRSAAVSHGLPFVTLPASIDLSDSGAVAAYAKQVAFALRGADGKEHTMRPSLLVFYAAALVHGSDPAAAHAFLHFLLSPAGQAALLAAGYGPPIGVGF